MPYCLYSLKLECEKLASEKIEIQRHYVMVRASCFDRFINMLFLFCPSFPCTFPAQFENGHRKNSPRENGNAEALCHGEFFDPSYFFHFFFCLGRFISSHLVGEGSRNCSGCLTIPIWALLLHESSLFSVILLFSPTVFTSQPFYSLVEPCFNKKAKFNYSKRAAKSDHNVFVFLTYFYFKKTAF